VDCVHLRGVEQAEAFRGKRAGHLSYPDGQSGNYSVESPTPSVEPLSEIKMPVAITGTPLQIADALNEFSPAYHQDFSRVRELGKVYTGCPFSGEAAMALASPLRDVLLNWGATKRKALALQDAAEIANTLVSTQVYESLKHFELVHAGTHVGNCPQRGAS
jgi:hypothetical protein